LDEVSFKEIPYLIGNSQSKFFKLIEIEDGEYFVGFDTLLGSQASLQSIVFAKPVFGDFILAYYVEIFLELNDGFASLGRNASTLNFKSWEGNPLQSLIKSINQTKLKSTEERKNK